jgi:hypothetical protein
LPLDIRIDDDVLDDLEDLQEGSDDIVAEIVRYSKEETGDVVAYAPGGSLATKALWAAGYEILFRVDRTNPEAPVMIVSDAYASPDQGPTGSDD